jgi:DNA-binding LacI/PurR family transcriptional regulator
MQNRVTIQNIAARVGLHFTTVAEALRNGVRVKPSTRAKIHAMAREMGYVPDPMLAALSAYRKAIKPPIYHETLAWVTSHPSRSEWRGSFGRIHQGAVQRAAELGYRLEEFWIKQPGMTSKKASRQLYNRGIRGLLIAPLFAARGHLSLEWDRFAAVALGYTLSRPRLNLVSTTHFRAVSVALRHLKAAGHRRIGWVSSSVVDERTNRLWVSTFLSELNIAYGAANDAILSFRSLERRRFIQWYEKFRPDAILTSCVDPRNPFLIGWLRKEGYRVPQDVSVAVVNLQEESEFSGVIEPDSLIGRTAIDLLARMLQNGERGIPEYPLLQLIEGKWNEGTTIAPLNKALSEHRQPQRALSLKS